MKIVGIILFFLFIPLSLVCQNKVDSSYAIYLDQTVEDSIRYRSLISFATTIAPLSPDSAITVLSIGLDEIENKDLPKIKIELLNLIGFAWGLKGNNENQIDYYEQCLALSEELDYGMGICSYYVNMGVKSTNDNNYSKAIELFKESLRVSEEHGFHENDELILMNLGHSYFANENYMEAIASYSKAQKIFIQKQDSLGISDTFQNIAEVLKKQGNTEKALNLQIENAELCEKMGDLHYIGLANYALAKTYILIKEFDKSLDHIRYARNKFMVLGDTKMIGLCDLSEGYIWLGIGSYNDAKEYCESASELLENDADIETKIDICNCLSAAYKSLGDYKKAIENMEISYTLSEGIQKIGMSKELQKSEFEIEQLADSLTNVAMRHELEMNHQAELRKNNVKKNIITSLIIITMIIIGLWSRLNYIRRTNKELEKAKEKAEQSEKFKQQFLANMSHEIRTPMNAVLGMTNLMLDTPLSSKQKKYLNAVKSSSNNLLVIINDILDLSKLEAGKMELEHAPFKLKEKVVQVVNTLRFKAEEKGIRITSSFEKDVPEFLIGDAGRLIQILINLCSNAIKFTEKGSVNIEVQKVAGTESTIKFRVIDTGLGIPRVKIDKLFDAFQQGDISTSRKYGGTGLGLTITRNLIEMQKGEIFVESEVGKGSVFSFTIPYEIALHKDVPKPMHIDIAELSGLKVLIAEDNEYNQIVINDTLVHLIPNVHIQIAHHGQEAIDLLLKNEFDIILMDVQMPEMNGLEATKFIRNKLSAPKNAIPIIALTASVLASDIQKCIDIGMNAFVPKPFKRQELLLALLKCSDPNNQYSEIVESKPPDGVKISENNEAITDLSFLREFCDSDEERMHKYIDLYKNSTPKNLKKINDLLKINDLKNARIIIHSMKPHLNFMGMTKARELAEKIESQLDQNEKVDMIKKQLLTLSMYAKKSYNELL